MLARLPASKRRRTIAADKAYDTRDFVARPVVWGSPRTSRRTPRTEDPRSMVAPPATPATSCRSGYANGSRNRSGGSRPSAVAASCDTSADNETGPGSRSKPPSTTSSESPPSTPPPPDRDDPDHRGPEISRIWESERTEPATERAPSHQRAQDPNFSILLTVSLTDESKRVEIRRHQPTLEPGKIS